MAEREPIRKTYKLFIGGAFPRSESGRTYPVVGASGAPRAWGAPGSRKDARDAVAKARGAFAGWSAATAYNRGQILYRVAEIMEGRTAQLTAQLDALGPHDDIDAMDGSAEVGAAIDRFVYYAGWTDKIAVVGGSANPVSGPYFNFTVPEPTGVVAILAPERPALLGLVALLAPALAAGNTVVVVAPDTAALVAVELAECLATSDVPAGVVNILTGRTEELAPVLAGHGDVDALDLTGIDDAALAAECERLGADDVKRLVRPYGPRPDWARAAHAQAVLATMELKTVWHPKGR
jgi:acyl-CoA reductase-like NAD-dependent aldehyde dehydrogenase